MSEIFDEHTNPVKLLIVIGWAERELARRTNYPPTTVHRWFDGTAKNGMPLEIRQKLARIANAIVENNFRNN